MPKLLLFAPCERVIVEQGTGMVSLQSILQNINAKLPPTDRPVPDDPIAMEKWTVFTFWQRVPDDEGRMLEQRVKLVSPTGVTRLEVLTTFQMTKGFHRNINRVKGFPIKEAGRHALTLELREAGAGEADWVPIAEYPLSVTHTHSPVTTS